jgi:site-specific DNA-methyltransferase (adenine-specific)
MNPYKRKEVIGNATLYLGDCGDMLPNLIIADALVIDPPYGVMFAGSATRHSAPSGISYASFEDTPANVEFEIVPRVVRAIASCKRALVTPGIRNARLYPKPDGEGVVWYPSGANSGPWGFVTHQPIFYYGKCPYLATRQGSRPTGFQSTEAAEENGHPCPKPIGQMIWMVNRVSLPEETVLDAMMGSGTTGVACMKSNRKFIGIEIEPKYFDIACQRIENAQRQERMFA